MKSPFKNLSINNQTEIILVSDFFSSDIVGGAELTTEALLEKCNFKLQKIYSKDLTYEILESGLQKFWIFTNFATMDLNLIPSIITNLKYAVIEYDYKFCKYRSPEKHFHFEGKNCDCELNQHGKLISTFYYGAQSLWFMSEDQKCFYESKFSFLKDANSFVLSSVFSDDFFKKINKFKKLKKNDKYLVLNSKSWIKNTSGAVNWCNENSKNFELVSGLTHDNFLKKLSESKSLVYLPLGKDTCPRIVIEAKLLNCDIKSNNNVQHLDEDWFNQKQSKIISYLKSRPLFFWSEISKNIKDPSISGYTTTYNCISQKYPFKQSILSMVPFCNEIIVVDGGSTDGTVEELKKLSKLHKKIKIHEIKRDWNDSRFAVFDGQQKAEARRLCESDFCWQQDVDEIVHHDDCQKIINIINNFPNTMDLIALPVIEYWGGYEKVRLDVNPWKWRLSRNKKYITHGIPNHLRSYDDDKKLYAKQGTDGCDYIRDDDGTPIPCGNFYNSELHKLRVESLKGDNDSLLKYEKEINNIVNLYPGVFHYSWFNLERKINTYKNYWTRHWQSMYNIEQLDISENNMFFNKPWQDVTNEEISELAVKLKEEMGGWIFHSKIDFNKKTPSIYVKKRISLIEE